jgi:hypothetical protein
LHELAQVKGTKASPSRFGDLLLSFEANKGQTAKEVKFLARGKGYSLFLMPESFVVSLRNPGAGGDIHDALAENGIPSQDGGRSKINGTEGGKDALVRVSLVGANRNARATGVEKLSGTANYFIGNNPQKWAANIPTYARVRFEQVYPGVDLVYYGNQRELEYDFIVAPGGDTKRIRLKLGGTSHIQVDGQGNLQIETPYGPVLLRKPSVYQQQVGMKQEVAARYVLEEEREVRFEVGKYDRTKPLVLDPVVSYSTFLGGDGDDYGHAIATDAAGSVYITGDTQSTNFPTKNPIQGTLSGSLCGDFPCTMAFVAKLTPDGSAFVYSTYLGGSGENSGRGIAVDANGSAYLTGFTTTSDFPQTTVVSAVTSGAFVTKVSPSGTSLSYSIILGGTNGAVGAGIAVNSPGNAFVVGNTQSSDFPTTAGAVQTSFGGTVGGDGDAFVTKVNVDGKSLAYSTYLGGSADESGRAIAIDGDGNAYIAGTTSSTDFPIFHAFQSACAVNCSNPDVFVSKIDVAGANLLFSTYLGGSGREDAKGIAVDASRDVYVAGNTQSFDFPTVSAFESGNPNSNGFPITFLTKFNADGASLAFSTYIQGLAFASLAIDPSKNIYLSGFGGSAIPMVNPVQNVLSGCCMTLMKFNSAGSGLIYSTYFGGGAPLSSHVTADALGNAYMTGGALSGLPLSPSVFQTQFAGQGAIGGDVYVVKVAAADAPGISLRPYQLNFVNQPVGSTSDPASITVFNTGSLPLSINNVTASGDFFVTPDTNCVGIVAAAGSCNLSVTFTPTTSGKRAGTIALTDNAAGSPQTIALSGTTTSTAPFDTASETFMDFGAQQVGVTSAAKMVTLTNTGSSTLNIASIASIGGPFAETNTCAATLSAGSQCTISITFTPSSPGPVPPVGWNITVTSNAPDSPKRIYLTGVGYQGPPGVFLDFNNLNFGSVLVGGFSSPQTSTLYNNTNTPLTLSSVMLAGPNAKDFVLANFCADGIVPAGSYCGLQVAFQPNVSGNESATITITDSGAGSPHKIALSGVGVIPAPSVSLSAPSIAFGNVPLGTSSAPTGLMIENLGNGTLNFASIQISGTNANDFSLTNQCGATLGVGSVCGVQVSFKPSATGTRSATLALNDNAPGSPQTVSLTGAGVTAAAGVGLAPTGLDFGTVLMGTASSPQAVTLTNTGNISLSITTIAVVGIGYTQTNNCAGSVAAGANCTINISYAPSSFGTNQTRIDITDNAANSPQSITLSGTGTEFLLGPASGASTSQTVTAGQTAQYMLTLTPSSTTRDTVTLSCTGAPATTSCSVLPTLQTFTTTNPIPVSVSVSTSARGLLPRVPDGRFLPPTLVVRFLLWLAWSGALFLVITLARQLRNTDRCYGGAQPTFSMNLALLVCLSILLTASACGGGSTPPPPPPPTGTPAGNYHLNITVKSASSTNPDQNVALTLSVR